MGYTYNAYCVKSRYTNHLHTDLLNLAIYNQQK